MNKIWPLHTMEYYSTSKKEGNFNTCYNLENEPLEHYTKCNQPVTTGQILYDFTYTKYLKQSSLKSQRVQCWEGEVGVII